MTAIATQERLLWLQGLDLMMADPHPIDGYRIRASADGHSWGELEPVINAIASQLSDGDLEDVERFNNRDITIRLLIDAPGHTKPGLAIAAGEEALELACRWPGWGALRWRSVLAGAQTSVLEVLWAIPQRESDEFHVREQYLGQRVFTLTMRVRPFVRPETPVTIDAPPLPPDPETPMSDMVVMDGTTTVGVTPLPLLAQPSDGAWLAATDKHVEAGVAWSNQHFDGKGSWYTPPRAWVRISPPGGFQFLPDRPFLRIRGRARWRIGAGQPFTGNGTYNAILMNPVTSPGGSVKVISNGPTGDGTWETLLQGTGTLTSFELFADWSGQAGSQVLFTASIGIDDITLIATPPEGVFTGKVQSRHVDIEGSQRTELSLSVLGLDAAGTPTGLGEQVLVCSFPAGAGDDSRAKFASVRNLSNKLGDQSSTDATAVTGVYNAVTSALTFSFSASALMAGDIALYPRLMALTQGDHVLSYRVSITNADGTQTITGPTMERRIRVGPAGASPWPAIPEDTWRIVPLGFADMLVDAVPGGTVTLTLSAAPGLFRVDDVFLAHTLGQVTLADTAKAGGSMSKVTIDASTLERPYPTVWVGEVNGSMMDAVRAGRLQAGGEEHHATPTRLLIATVTPGCGTSRLSGVYFPRNGWDVAGAADGGMIP